MQAECGAIRTPALAAIATVHDSIPVRYALELRQPSAALNATVGPAPDVCFNPPCESPAPAPGPLPVETPGPAPTQKEPEPGTDSVEEDAVVPGARLNANPPLEVPPPESTNGGVKVAAAAGASAAAVLGLLLAAVVAYRMKKKKDRTEVRALLMPCVAVALRAKVV